MDGIEEQPIDVAVRRVSRASTNAIHVGVLVVANEAPRSRATAASSPARVEAASSTDWENPIALTCPEDTRPAVRDLLAQHRKKLAALRGLVEDHEHFQPGRHDDLWLLRFLLSHGGKPAVAAAKARGAITFRHARRLDEVDLKLLWPRTDVVQATAADHFFAEGTAWQHFRSASAKYDTCCGPDALIHLWPDPDRSIITIIKMAGLDMNALAHTLTNAEQACVAQYYIEWASQLCDFVTRRTGRLTKSIRLVEARGMALTAINKEYLKRDAAIAAETEDFYPQLLASIYICHSPGWLQIVWRVLRPLFPKRFVEKMDMIQPATNKGEVRRLRRHLDPAHLPTSFGGQCEASPPPILGRRGNQPALPEQPASRGPP